VRIRPAARRFAVILALAAIAVSGTIAAGRALDAMLPPGAASRAALSSPAPSAGGPDAAERAGNRPAQPLCARQEVRRHGDESSASAKPVGAVPILVYHYVRGSSEPADSVGYRLSVSPHDFAAQMDLLRARGAHAITLGELVDALQGKATLPAHPVVISFDDGYLDFLRSALPVLRRDGMCATLFAVPGFLGRPSYLTADQLRTVARAGVVIGAHTMTHPDLTKVSPAALADEVARSGKALRGLTGQAVTDFAYPYGFSDDAVAAAVQNAGYSDAVTMNPGLPEGMATRFTLPRQEVIGGEPLEVFAAQAGV
jgi:peptidoglycan/xylan/chitin deacetylase (PgdA/CDA1 family)